METTPMQPNYEQVEQWISEVWHEGTPVRVAQSDIHLAQRAYSAGADAELDECVRWLAQGNVHAGQLLRNARRQMTLKQQALLELENLVNWDRKSDEYNEREVNALLVIRKALESMPE